jgi:DNA-binding Lrp family transcriptional regulator
MADDVLKLLLEGEALDQAQIANILGRSEADIHSELDDLKKKGILLGWRPILHPACLAEGEGVHALIEVKIIPEREGGFDRIAERIARFREVETCYLMSGAYDLLVIVHGKTLHSVANFVAARLSSIEGVTSTATHFMLKVYKEQGHMFERDQQDPDKLQVSP